jgi:hypothetical protein
MPHMMRNIKMASEIRLDARKALAENGQYLRYVGTYLLLMLVVVAVSIPLMGILGIGIGASGIAPFFAPGGWPEVGLFLDPDVMIPLLASVLAFSMAVIYPLGYISWGQAAMAIAAMRRGLTVGHAFSGWGHGWKMGWIMAVKLTYINLWALLLVVPGIVKALSYAMTEYVAVDHPDWGANRCIAESRRLMDGNKLRYLCLLLSFFGWFFLVMLVNTVPLVGGFAQWFFMPYFETAKAAFYEDLLDSDSGL